jgi:predicted lipid carrier protein YhbT
VAGAPGGELRYGTVLADGRVVGGDVTDADADVTLTLKHADALGALRGELDLNALFMQGRMKVAGPTGPLLDVLAYAQTDPVQQARAALAADTDA